MRLQHLRNVQTGQNLGWQVFKLHCLVNGKFEINFNYSDRPAFTSQPGKEKFIDDLTSNLE